MAQLKSFYPDESKTDNSNPEQIERLYLECAERDKRINTNIFDRKAS